MAQIPDYTALPQSVPVPSYRRVMPDESGRIVAGAAEGLGRGLEEVGTEQYTQEQGMLSAKGETAVTAHELAVGQAAEQMRQSVADGTVPYEQARAKFDDQVSKIPPPDFGALNPRATLLLQRQMQQNVSRYQFGIDNVVAAARKDDFKAQFGQGLDALGKLAGMPGADVEDINQRGEVYRPLARQAGLPESFVSSTLEKWKEQNWYNQATQRAMESKDNLHSLGQLQHDLVDADGFYAGRLDTDKRNVVLRNVLNAQETLRNRIEHEQDRREAKAQGALAQYDMQISSGIPATPQMLDHWSSLIKGTSFEQDFKKATDDETEVQKVLREPVDQQVKFVQDRQSALEQNGGTLRDLANLHRLRTAVQQNVQLMQKEPLQFAAARTGTEVAPLNFQEAATPEGAEQFGQQIADRMATLKSLRTQYGPSIAMRPLLSQEAAALSTQLESAKPEDRVRMLTTLRNSMHDDVAYENAMAQIAPKSPVTSILGRMVNASSPAALPSWFDNRFAPTLDDATYVAAGDRYLNPPKKAGEEGAGKPVMTLPEDKGFAGLRAQFQAAAGDRFSERPELMAAHYQIFRDAYAGLLAEHGNNSGQGDPALAREALKIALGNSAHFNGRDYTVPAGMDPSQFEGLVRESVAATARQHGLGPAWTQNMHGYQLQELGPLGSGVYRLTLPGQVGQVMTPDKTGYITIDLRDQYLGNRGSHRGEPNLSPQQQMEAGVLMPGGS